MTVSPDGILAGWLTGYSARSTRAPVSRWEQNVRVTDANGQSKVVKVDQAYIFVKAVHNRSAQRRFVYRGETRRLSISTAWTRAILPLVAAPC